MALSLITGTSTSVCSLTEIKDFLRISSTDEDTLLEKLTLTAQQIAENYQGRTYRTQTWEYEMPSFPLSGESIELPMGAPLQSVTSIKYYDTDGTETTWSSTSYHVDIKNEPGKVVLRYGEVYPSDLLQTANGLVITYVAGSTDQASFEKRNYMTKLWIMNAVSQLYEKREKDLSEYEFGALRARRVRGIY